MKINISGKEIEFKKEQNKLDRFVIEFTSLLNRLQIRYVIVSGYIAILFGRSRTSEDVDIIVEKLDFKTFTTVWNTTSDDYYCINTNDAKEAYEDYLSSGISLRFAKKNTFIPNIEFKFPKTDLDRWTARERKKVIINDHYFYIAPLELQISFKLHLGSEKDIEDARHLYKLFEETLDMTLIQEFNRKLKTQTLFQRYLQ
ncbi:MAG TPA: hypothetical protein VMY59_10445 [Candidatus Thermoplasmatota archaeon]|nr:hypothetical protein [Candidatus Thermoplasmatota archaeon]